MHTAQTKNPPPTKNAIRPQLLFKSFYYCHTKTTTVRNSWSLAHTQKNHTPPDALFTNIPTHNRPSAVSIPAFPHLSSSPRQINPGTKRCQRWTPPQETKKATKRLFNILCIPKGTPPRPQTKRKTVRHTPPLFRCAGRACMPPNRR